MKFGNLKKVFFFIFFIYINNLYVFADDKIESVPLINLEELSPTFEESKDELEKEEEKFITSNENNVISDPLETDNNDKIYINLQL